MVLNEERLALFGAAENRLFQMTGTVAVKVRQSVKVVQMELVNPLVLDFSGQISWRAVGSDGRCDFDICRCLTLRTAMMVI